MNLQREDKIEIILSPVDIIQALRALHPDEWLLKRLKLPSKERKTSLQFEVASGGCLKIIYREIVGSDVPEQRLLGHGG